MTVVPGPHIEFADLPGRRSGDPLEHLEAMSSLRIVRLEHQPHRLAHRHPRSEEIVYVRRGTGTVYVDGARSTVGPGDVVHIPAGAAHATIPDPGEAMELICFFPHPSLGDNIEETQIDVMTEETDE